MVPPTHRVVVPFPTSLLLRGPETKTSPEPAVSNGSDDCFSADLQELFDDFSHRSETTPSQAFKKGMISIVWSSREMTAGDSSDLVGDHLRHAASFLHKTTSEEMSLLPPAEWVWLAAAFYAVGHMSLMVGENPECVKNLFQGAADFLSRRDRSYQEDRTSFSGEILFFQDACFAFVLMSFIRNGWFQEGMIRPDQGPPLAELLRRMALVSGGGAIDLFYPGFDLSPANKETLLRPSAYLHAAKKLRQD